MKSTSGNSAESNPAVFRCCKAWRYAYDEAMDNPEDEEIGPDQEDAEAAADRAYADAMPPLFGVRNIRNYIACVAHGSVIGVIAPEEASRLLYAAQIAFSTCRIRPPREKSQKTTKSPETTPSGAISEPKNAIPEPFTAPACAA